MVLCGHENESRYVPSKYSHLNNIIVLSMKNTNFCKASHSRKHAYFLSIHIHKLNGINRMNYGIYLVSF
jgi:hypothetical protein